MFDRGYVTLARFRGAPIKLHWTLIVGMLWVSGLRFAPGAWAAYALLILLHEMGHASLVRGNGLAVKEIMLHGLGGHCAYVGYPSPFQQSVIATGGVLAQLVLLAIAWPVSLLVGADQPNAQDFFQVMTFTNVYLILFNLIPIAPLDGALISKLPGLWRKRRREVALRSVEQQEIESQRAFRIAQARSRSTGVELVDDRAVKDLVKKALEDAKRAAKDRSSS